MTNDNSKDSEPGKLGPAGWITILILVGLLIWAGWYGLHAWNELSDVSMSGFGWAMVVLGVLLTFGLGAGLMALVFYSSRKDYDR